MGTNYYLVNNECECCDRYDRVIHLGKSSGGWSFTFRGYRGSWSYDYEAPLDVDNFTEWKALIEKRMEQGCRIRDEYGKVTELAELLALIASKRKGWNHAKRHPGPNDWVDEFGNSFTSTDFS